MPVKICYNTKASYWDMAKLVKAQDFDSCISLVRVQLSQPTKTEHLSTDKCSVFVYPIRRIGMASPESGCHTRLLRIFGAKDLQCLPICAIILSMTKTDKLALFIRWREVADQKEA